MIEKINIVNFEKIQFFTTKELGEINYIKGKNGSGKTSLARAIIWCLTGKDIDGQANATRYIGPHKNSVSVSVTFQGVTYERTRTKTKSSFSENGEMVPDDAFLRKYNLTPESFLIIFFPGFFLKMTELKQRDVFMSITPPVDENEILKEMGIDFVLKGNVKDAHKQWNDRKILLEKNLASYTGRLAALNGDNVPNDAQEQISSLSSKIDGLRAKKLECEKIVRQHNSEQMAFNAWFNQKQNIGSLLQHRDQVIAQNKKNAELRKAQENEPAMREHLKQLEAGLLTADKKLEELINKGNAQKEKLKALESATCPTCNQSIPVKPDDLNEAKENIKRLRTAFVEAQKFRDAIKEERDDLAEAVSVFVPVPADMPVPEIKEVEQAHPPKLSKEEAEDQMNKSISLENEISFLSSEKAKLEARVQLFAKNKKDFDETSKLVESTKEELDKATKIAASLHPKTGLPAIALRKRMEHVSMQGFQFHFTETLKNGEERECFHILREDSLPIEYLSSGEQIKFCVELSRLVVLLCKTEFNCIFLERYDLLDEMFHVTRHNAQYFFEEVDEGDLRVATLMKESGYAD